MDATALRESLIEHGLAEADEAIDLEPLAGGVSCDVFKVPLRRGPVCVKQALPRLRVEEEWLVSPERAHAEAMWLECAGRIGVPAPRLLYEDRERNFFVMEFCPGGEPWKARLARGEADPAFASSVGTVLARMHIATMDRPDVARDFANAELFDALRIDPFLLHCARNIPELAGVLEDLAERARATRLALVHGDLSPKNILVGPVGPVILDAECANYGDPAFDVAFCTTHLLLKSVWQAQAFDALLGDARAFLASYRSGLGAGLADDILGRATGLVAALLLARVDGKSPVEYLDAAGKASVRARARAWLLEPPPSLGSVLNEWANRKEVA